MAFSYTISGRDIFGSKKIVYGTFTNDEDSTGGDIDLTRELHSVNFFWAQGTGTDAATQPIVNESFPAPPSVTIVTAANQVGIWGAWGL